LQNNNDDKTKINSAPGQQMKLGNGNSNDLITSRNDANLQVTNGISCSKGSGGNDPLLSNDSNAWRIYMESGKGADFAGNTACIGHNSNDCTTRIRSKKDNEDGIPVENSGENAL
jgi:hypothetical protein